MANYAAFMLVILGANVIQGITGFAGTILAMPPALMLVGYDVAKPVLNMLGLLSGVYVFVGARKKVLWVEVWRIVAVMAAGIVMGFLVRGVFADHQQLLYRCLGVFVIALSIQGAAKLWRGGLVPATTDGQAGAPPLRSYALLVAAGVVHGIFVCGGPLLIGYLSKRVANKERFRATISTVWIFLNGLILAEDIFAGAWTPNVLLVGAASVPFLLAGMFFGGRLMARMDQRAFTWLTYALLFVSGVLLLVK